MKKELFSIPNLMGYFRILMLPVFLMWYHQADTPREFGAAFALLAVIFLSDALDGFVARKFNMVTSFGKILDPVADKLVQGTLALAVSFRHSWMKVFLAIFLIKEVYMGAMGMYLLRAKHSLNGARWYGKLCTAVADSGILILLFLPKLPADISNIMILCMIGVELFTIGMYLKFHFGILREKH